MINPETGAGLVFRISAADKIRSNLIPHFRLSVQLSSTAALRLGKQAKGRIIWRYYVAAGEFNDNKTEIRLPHLGLALLKQQYTREKNCEEFLRVC